MIHTLKLLLPALIPSWNFFDIIAPSPRIQFCCLESPDETPQAWQEYRPRPESVSFWQMLKRMIWNPEWNQSLYLMSCAERLLEYPSLHSEQQIMTHIRTSLLQAATESTHVCFRLVLITREGTELVEEVVYLSDVIAIEYDLRKKSAK